MIKSYKTLGFSVRSKPKSIITFTSSKCLSIYIKILINYSQMLRMSNKIGVKWPDYISIYFPVLGYILNISTQLFSFDCLINDYDIPMKAIYLKGVSTFSLYLAISILSFLVILIRSISRNKKNIMNKMIILIIVLSITIQPNNIQEFFSTLVCQEINKKKYLSEDLSIECYTSYHNHWVIFYFLYN